MKHRRPGKTSEAERSGAGSRKLTIVWEAIAGRSKSFVDDKNKGVARTGDALQRPPPPPPSRKRHRPPPYLSGHGHGRIDRPPQQQRQERTRDRHSSRGAILRHPSRRDVQMKIHLAEKPCGEEQAAGTFPDVGTAPPCSWPTSVGADVVVSVPGQAQALADLALVAADPADRDLGRLLHHLDVAERRAIGGGEVERDSDAGWVGMEGSKSIRRCRLRKSRGGGGCSA